MPTAAPDFRIFWDNAYAFHHLTEDEAKSADILAPRAPPRAPEPADHVRLDLARSPTPAPASRSSPRRARQRRLVPRAPSNARRSARTRSTTCATCELFGSAPTACATTCAEHREILAPKFAAVDAALTDGLAGLGRGRVDPTRPAATSSASTCSTACASRVVALAKEAGIALTPAGASFPHGRDPRDRNIRLAPTFPELDEVETAMAGVATCVALATAERLADIG